VGPALQGFGVQDFMITSAQNINTQQLPKYEREKVGPALQDFGTRDFMITSAQTPTEHKLLK
jgi:hypothetical protein